jgi:hypothetical protein
MQEMFESGSSDGHWAIKRTYTFVLSGFSFFFLVSFFCWSRWAPVWEEGKTDSSALTALGSKNGGLLLFAINNYFQCS